MKIGLVDIIDDTIQESLGIQCIYEYLNKKKLNTDLLFINVNKELSKQIEELITYDYIGFSINHLNANKIYEIVNQIKAANPRLLVFGGGIFATLCAELILKDCKNIDFIVLGHGEIPLYEFITEKEDAGIIPKSKYIIKQKEDLSEKSNFIMPIQERVNLEHRVLKQKDFNNTYVANIFSAISCCSQCSFCTHNYNVNNNSLRWQGRRKPEDIYQEILDIYNKYGIRMINFNDGSFEEPGYRGKEWINNV